MIMDLDHFKKINDRYGHTAGDEVLRWFASQCSAVIRQKLDLVGRFSGEEFASVYPEADLSVAPGAAERLRSQIFSTAVQYSEMKLKGRLLTCRGNDRLGKLRNYIHIKIEI